jgi:hypothetical protein
VTIARFRSRHAQALAGVFIDSLRLCAEAGLVRLGVIAMDGTKMGANAAIDANRTMEMLDKQIAAMIDEAEAIDAGEDNRDDDNAGQPPAGMVDPVKRRAQLAAAQQRLQAAQQRLRATAQERAQRLAERTAVTNTARAAKGLPPRVLRPRPNEKPLPDATANLTDPDSRVMLARQGRVQVYNAQWACTAQQIIVAAQVSQAGNDVEQLEPMLAETRQTLTAAGIAEQLQAVVADAGYWRAANVDSSIPNAPELFISVAKHARPGQATPGWAAHRGQDPPPRRGDESQTAYPTWEEDAASPTHHHRAPVRPGQGKPPPPPLRPPRTHSRPSRMATHRRREQPPQTPPGPRDHMSQRRRPPNPPEPNGRHHARPT